MRIARMIFLFVLMLGTAAAVPAQRNLIRALEIHVEKNRDDAEEYPGSRIIKCGDLNGDGRRDAVVQYYLYGSGGGRHWDQFLVVFLNSRGVYREAAFEKVGGKYLRTFKLAAVQGREIIGDTKTCPPDGPQGFCDDPKKERVRYILENGKLHQQ